jgi:transposase-like protein
MRVYSREFRIQVVRRILDGEKIPALSEELKIHRKLLYEWIRRVNEGGESNLRERGRPRKSDTIGDPVSSGPRQVVELERTIAHQQLVIEFLAIALQHMERRTRKKKDWRESIFAAIEGMLARQSGLTVEKMCELAGIARSGYYRHVRTRRETLAALPLPETPAGEQPSDLLGPAT